ncbi:HAD family hydrolase [Candidatus Magnetominusculus dajiuhuensis]|uniref:HAD family hydrolase n=1 Tax=Candidatus Magnetominusculus dajiuhuensis TaxID=3137712 RepID=UPI003B43CCE8
MRAALFDLDDTLYREMDYVEGGFRAVGGFLSNRYGFKEKEVFDKAVNILHTSGRGKVFDKLIEFLGISNEEIVRYLIYIYRTHKPAISVYGDVIPVFEYLRSTGVKTGLITDGMAIVQQNKVSALGIAGLFDVIIYTDAIGADYWKPSPVAFNMALNILNTPACESVYVGDDPSKDFIAPNALAMKTVQIIRNSGTHKQTPEGRGYAAQAICNSLSEYFRVAP